MKTILIVDDNESICNILYHYGKEAGYTMVIAHTGQEGLTYFTNYKPDVILLDVMLPDIDGFEVCQCIRKVSRVPILMITAKTADQDRVMGLDIGADDYILKPFSCQEVMARIRAVLRRTEDNPEQADFVYGNLMIQESRNLVSLDGKPINLTKKEMELLVLLASHPGQVYSREILLDLVWGYSGESYDRAVDSCVKRLRAKLDEYPHPCFSIKTIWGVGYSFAYEEKKHEQADK